MLTETNTRIYEIIAKQLEIEVAAVRPTASLVDDLGADSIDLVEIFMAIEEAFDIEIHGEDSDKLHTARDIIDFVSETEQ
ncbi:MAG: acyl carrier protein [Nitrospirae bacterium]|nr:acyl carrier protein [Nitrospirota bacterium]